MIFTRVQLSSLLITLFVSAACNNETGFYSTRTAEFAPVETQDQVPLDPTKPDIPPPTTDIPGSIDIGDAVPALPPVVSVPKPPVVVVPPPTPENPNVITIGGATKTLDLTINQVNVTESEEVDLIILIDDSPSMKNKIDRMTASLENFLATIIARKTKPVHVAIVPLSAYAFKATQGHVIRKKSTDEFLVLPPNPLSIMGHGNLENRNYLGQWFNYEILLDKSYDKVTWPETARGIDFKYYANISAQTLPSIRADLNTISNSLTETYDKEYLISALMNHLSHRSLAEFGKIPPSKGKLRADGASHIVVLTDEDNDLPMRQEQGRFHEVPGYYGGQMASRGTYEVPTRCSDDVEVSLVGHFGGCTKDATDYDLRHDRYHCVVSPAAGSDWNAPLSIFSTMGGYAPNNACRSYNKFNCTKTLDGVDIDQSNIDASQTDKTTYKSCRPVLNTAEYWNVKNYHGGRLFAEDFEQCHPAACTEIYQVLKWEFVTNTSGIVTRVKLQNDGVCKPGFRFIPPSASRVSDTIFPSKCNSDFASGVLQNLPQFVRKYERQLEKTSGQSLIVATRMNVPQSQIQAYFDIFHHTHVEWLVQPRNFKLYRANPLGFMEFLKEIHSAKRIQIHSIVSTNGQKCAGDSGTGVVRRAEEMIKVTNATGGIIGNICDANYNPILERVVTKVSTNTVSSYDLKPLNAEFSGASSSRVIVKVENITKGKEIPLGMFSYAGGVLHLPLSEISSGDKIRVTYR